MKWILQIIQVFNRSYILLWCLVDCTWYLWLSKLPWLRWRITWYGSALFVAMRSHVNTVEFTSGWSHLNRYLRPMWKAFWLLSIPKVFHNFKFLLEINDHIPKIYLLFIRNIRSIAFFLVEINQHISFLFYLF